MQFQFYIPCSMRQIKTSNSANLVCSFCYRCHIKHLAAVIIYSAK